MRAGRLAIAAALTVWGSALLAQQPAPPGSASAGSPAASPVTFTEHVAPILFASCATCHRATGSAPFSLLTYEDARQHGAAIAAATRRRAMPPWKPEPGHGVFANDRRLSEAQIAAIQTWVARGMPQGDPARLPPVPSWSGRWQLGEPDIVLQTAPYTLRATGDDMYRNFVLPIPVTTTRWVRAWEFLPGNTRVVHHATMQVDTTGESRRLDAQDASAGYEGLIAHSVQSPDGFFLDWGPGHMPYVAPDGMAWPIQPGSDLVMMMHLRPSGREEPLQGTLGLYLSDTPPVTRPLLVRLTRQHLDIAAGDARYPVTDSFTLNADVEVYTVQPHAHYLAHEVKGTATLPDGTRQPLILIKDWDFDWQGVYRYQTPLFLPAGTTLSMEFIYDNSAGNPRNPHTPPRRVTYGQRTTDEMAELWFQVVPRRPADREPLIAAIRQKVLREEIVGHEKMLEAEPGNTALHDGVALLHASMGNIAGAVDHFAATAKANPGSAPARYNLGVALSIQGRLDDAAVELEAALRLNPDYARAHDALGTLRQRQGRLDEAIARLRDAVRLSPGDAEMRAHLEAALAAGKTGAATAPAHQH